ITTPANDWYKKPRVKAYRLGLKLLRLMDQKRPLIQKLTNGYFLQRKFKLKPGPKLGKTINEIKTAIIFGKIRSKEDLERLLKNR
ncbi:MAG: hypothetical protein HY459_03140, partial [Parcubacteria group bacterium]|nr:hypothetical protein [Parcubacteria group bacterium]